MKIETVLHGIHASFTRRRWTQLFTAFVRVLLGLAFIPPSIPKILHRPFTVLPESNPVGAYFSALYNTGFYYDFIGWSQIAAAILLLVPRTSHIGALMFFPIIVNIAVLTTSVGFEGTWLITLLMSLAALYLVAWEYDRLRPIVFASRETRPGGYRWQFLTIPIFFALGGAAMAVLWKLLVIGNFSNYAWVAGVLVVTGFVFGLIVALHYRFMPVGELDGP